MRSSRVLALSPLLLTLIAGTASAQSATERLAQQVKGAVVALDHRISMFSGRMSPKENPLDNSARTAGFVIDEQGHVITSARYVAGRSRIRVRFAGGAKAWAKVLGVDVLNGTAVLKLQGVATLAQRFGGTLPHLSWGSSSSLRPGYTVFALGNMFDALALDGQPTFSQGVVTSLTRMRTRTYSGVAVETDAAVNPGSFGGPLLDRKGRVVGVITRAYSARRWLGTAVPGDQVRLGAEAIMAGRKLTHGRLGIALKTTGGEASPKGLEITRVLDGSAAAKAGVAAGDRLLKLNGRAVYDTDDVARELGDLAPGSLIRLKVSKQGAVKLLHAVLDPGGAPVTRTIARAPTPRPRRPRVQRRPRLAHPASIGLRVEERDSGIGLVVLEVRPGGAAAHAGVEKGDILMRLGRQRLNTLDNLSDILYRYRPGERAVLLLLRNRRIRRVVVRFQGPTAARPRPTPAPTQPAPTPLPAAQRGYLGVYLDLESDEAGARIDGTVEDSPAAQAGLEKGDVVVRVDGRPIANTQAFVAILKSKRPNDQVRMRVRRGGGAVTVVVRLGAKPGTKPTPAPQPQPQPTPTGRPWLGVALDDASGAITIVQVDQRGTLAKAGVQVDDKILEFDGHAVRTLDAFADVFKGCRVGQQVKIKLERNGWTKEITVRLQARP